MNISIYQWTILIPEIPTTEKAERDQAKSSWRVPRNAGESLSEGVNLCWDQPDELVAGLPGTKKRYGPGAQPRGADKTNYYLSVLQTTEGHGHLTWMTFCDRPWSVLPRPRWLEHRSLYQTQLWQKEQRNAMENFPSKIICELIFLANPKPH